MHSSGGDSLGEGKMILKWKEKFHTTGRKEKTEMAQSLMIHLNSWPKQFKVSNDTISKHC